MYSRLSVTFEGHEFGESRREIRRTLAHELRQVADRVEAGNDDQVNAAIVDDLSNQVIGHVMLDIVGRE